MNCFICGYEMVNYIPPKAASDVMSYYCMNCVNVYNYKIEVLDELLKINNEISVYNCQKCHHTMTGNKKCDKKCNTIICDKCNGPSYVKNNVLIPGHNPTCTKFNNYEWQ